MCISEIAFGPWVVRANAEETRSRYASLREPPGGVCDCDACRNYILVREKAFPPEILSFLVELGIDPWQPYELSHYGRMPSGLHLYNGWHYFCGSVVSGPQSEFSNPHRVHPTFQMEMFETSKARSPFSEFRCVQVEVYTELPWVIDLTEPF